MPNAPSGTSPVIMEPAPVIARSPMVTGATSTQSLPVFTPLPTVVRCLRKPS